MFFKSLLVLAAAALAANAQSTTTTSAIATPSGVSDCVISCSNQAASAGGCSSFTDLSCVCTSTAFQAAAGACLQANCTATDIAQAQALQQSECASLSGGSSNTTTSGTATTVPTTTSSGTSSGTKTPTSPVSTTSSAKTSAATSSSAATGYALTLNSAFGGLVALAGTLIGAALVV
ncbi:uncharacterized protein EDB93DRAFT_1245900 [Suillus bovinus]|uniref:uncharacterized protein n=1 Tax=Suillus bovinus TaxID=48563 RepID=UPI001B877770|nr:uncharacterized protein EDB93DRAFT_1245900 [Suillus bovinus]KAG2158669.1 hypothetical protein EDB93DRAFT_1245900 [Suillus bovinus]